MKFPLSEKQPYLVSRSEENHDPTRTKAPGYKMGIKLPQGMSKKFGPGPAAYNTQGLTNMGKETSKAPKLAKAARFSDKVGTVSPGPAAYNREEGDKSIYPTAPAFSMPHSQRTKTMGVTTPGPNSYSLPTAFGPGKTPIVTGHAYSIGKAKREAFVLKPQSPGPAAYMLPSNDIHMNKAPAFYMGLKLPSEKVSSVSPGPAAHAAHLVKFDKYSTPRITFGIRHSPFKAMPGFAAEK
ncbi:outer dense fiber protein 3 [Trichonephila inaurata madagascariensis]|uniref:Outer dense fiber protein 3 n=1 Tax=Trichonephila inaurata madagascariensis TaxID=2747483 RepID=A0A8X6WTZ0_9ARAC|nr:outer dense fiber protein 3 [Trichonephila inaurata madagascariensis]